MYAAAFAGRRVSRKHLCYLCLDYGEVRDINDGKHNCPSCSGGVPDCENLAEMDPEVPF